MFKFVASLQQCAHSASSNTSCLNSLIVSFWRFVFTPRHEAQVFIYESGQIWMEIATRLERPHTQKTNCIESSHFYLFIYFWICHILQQVVEKMHYCN